VRAFGTTDYLDGVLSGDHRMLAKTITLLESLRSDHREIAREVLAELMPRTGNSLRVGISGPPGVGKSTLIEALGLTAAEDGSKVAVLAVDPSSEISGGSILGDKTRMPRLSVHPRAFIRPSPAAGVLGGVGRHTREAMLVLEAAGFDLLLVETVGVGQSETVVAGMVDFFLLLAAPNAGDELQGIKRGIMELADAVVVNKADGDFLVAAQAAASQIEAALRMLRHPGEQEWRPRVATVSALEDRGIGELRGMLESYRGQARASGELAKRRKKQARNWMWDQLRDSLESRFRNHPAVAAAIPGLEQKVLSGHLPPMEAVDRLLALFTGEEP
jgi:LAO/AO transport system kinase